MTSDAAPQPSTSENGVPFTARDVLIHTLATWVCSLILQAVLAVLMLLGGAGLLVALIAPGMAAISTALIWAGAPIAWLTGRVMRHVASERSHVLTFGVLGMVLGVIATALVLSWLAEALATNGEPMQFGGTTALLAGGIGVASGFCAATGRRRAFRSRHRRA